MIRSFIPSVVICVVGLLSASCGDSEMAAKVEAGKADTAKVIRPLCGKKVDVFGYHNCLAVVESYAKLTKRHRYGVVLSWDEKTGSVGIFWETAVVHDIDRDHPLYGPHSLFCSSCDEQLLGVYPLNSVQGQTSYKHFLEQG